MQLHQTILVAFLATLLTACGGSLEGNKESAGNFGGNSAGGGSNTTSPDNVSLLMYSWDIYGLELSGNGAYVTFLGTSNPVGKNPDEREQIFAINLKNNTVIQITNNNEAKIPYNSKYHVFDLSDDGLTLLFGTSDDITGNNPDREYNLFAASTESGAISQVTNGFDDSHSAQLSGDGSFIVFVSDNIGNTTDILKMDIDGNNEFKITTQDAEYKNVTLADNGSKIAFTTMSDLLGTNSDGSNEVFIISIDGEELKQITFSEDRRLLDKQQLDQLRISDDGTYVAFASDMSFVEGGTPHIASEIYVADTISGDIVQITELDVAIDISYLQLSGDGSYVFFTHNYDFTGENPDSDETVYWAKSSGEGEIVQAIRPDTLNEQVSYRSVRFGPHVSNDGNLIVFKAYKGYAGGSLGAIDYSDNDATYDDGIFTLIRQ